MKRCPTCNQSFEEDWLTFCTEDGTILVSESVQSSESSPTIMAQAPSNAAATSDSPYKFLSFYDFTEQDARLFFGRERETQILLSDILVARLVVLFAETGTGKTSLINAGVRPRLKERGYNSFLVRVSDDPVRSAQAELESALGIQSLPGDTLPKQLKKLATDLDTPIVIFFDQFEEFFISTFRENRTHAENFIRDIAELYEDEESGVHIVFSLREDWFVEMNHFRDEIPTIFHNDSNLRLRWFDKEQAGEAIRGPAAAFDTTIEPLLIDQITRDLFVEGHGIEPAQLQIVCDALWRNHAGPLITLKKDYIKLGEKKGATNIAKQILDQHFDKIFSAIEDEQLGLLERLLPLLSTERNTKFSRDFDSLIELLKTDQDSLNALLKHLEDSQLIRRTRREGLTMIELAHDYLAPQVLGLQERVRAISLRRLLRHAIQTADARATARAQTITDGASNAPLAEQGIQEQFLSKDDFETLRKGAHLLRDLSQAEADFMFEAALEVTTNEQLSELSFWFNKARESGVEVWRVLEQKITDPQALVDQSANAIRLLGILRTDQALKLLELALNQKGLDSMAVDALAEWKTPATFQLMLNAVKERRAVGPVIDKLGESNNPKAIESLQAFLSEDDLVDRAITGLERMSRSRSPHIADRASEILAQQKETKRSRLAPRPADSQLVHYEEMATRRKAVRVEKSIGGLHERDWELLIRQISKGRCTPIIGPEVGNQEAFTTKLASQWAQEEDYPFDKTPEFRDVAQFLATRYDAAHPIERLIDSFRFVPKPDFDAPYEPYRILANLPLPVYINTNYDDSMVQALRRGALPRDARREVCRWNRHLENTSSISATEYRPTVADPLVFHLWGHVEQQDSLVVTRDDRFAFWEAILRDPDRTPPEVQRALGNQLLLLGFDFADEDFYFLLRFLKQWLERGLSRTHTVVTTLTVPEGTSDDRVEKALKYFNLYFEKLGFRVYWGTAKDFLIELRERWEQSTATL